MKLTPVDKMHATPAEATLRKQWEANLSSYKKPAHNAPMQRDSRLLHSNLTDCSLGYVLFINGKQEDLSGVGALEFFQDDPEPMRKATVPLKTLAGFHVYYKNGAYWYGIPKHFYTLADAIPYLQGGNRVLIEYRHEK